MKRALTKTLEALYQHRWTILLPPKGLTWITTDNPVLRLNFNSINDYSFGGGWGSPGIEIYLPLSPHHLMYTQIGKRPPRRAERMSLTQAELIRRFTVEHAHRLVFASKQVAEVSRIRPRVVDADIFRLERDEWQSWHEQQTTAEQELMRLGSDKSD
jgi:hypothetical protein